MPATATRPKPKTAKSTATAVKRPKYPAAVIETTKSTRALLKSVSVGYSPGRREVARVRKLVGNAEPAKFAGVPVSVLRKYVQTGDIPADKKGKLPEIAATVNDSWTRGRTLAALLVVLQDEYSHKD